MASDILKLWDIQGLDEGTYGRPVQNLAVSSMLSQVASIQDRASVPDSVPGDYLADAVFAVSDLAAAQ